MVLSTCAALTADATEVAGSEGECDPAKQNLYEKSGSTLTLVNPTPGATLAAQSRAISADGSRVYWTDGANLYLRDGAPVKQVDLAAGGRGDLPDRHRRRLGRLLHQGRPPLPLPGAESGTATDLTPARRRARRARRLRRRLLRLLR